MGALKSGHAQGRVLRRQTGGGPVRARAPIRGVIHHSMFFPPKKLLFYNFLLQDEKSKK
jgi:hypothetical protein